MKISYQARVDKTGKLIIHDRVNFYKDIALLTGKDVSVTVKRFQRNRSNLQNSYYWSVVVRLVRDGLIDTGYRIGIEETHEFIKGKFAVRELVSETTGEIIKSVGSTAKMTTLEFSNFIEQIQQWSAEYLNIDIPSPNESLSIDFKD